MSVWKLVIDGACKFNSFQSASGVPHGHPESIQAFGDQFNYHDAHKEPAITSPDFRYFYTNRMVSDMEDRDFNLQMGFFASRRFVEFLHDLKTMPFKVYPIQYIRRKKIYDDYCYLLFYKGLRDYIDFGRSTFSIVHFFTGEAVERGVRFKDCSEFFARKFELLAQKNQTPVYEALYFKSKEYNEYDLFPLYLVNDDYYVSDRFIEGFRKRNLTGALDFIPADFFSPIG